MQAVEPELIGDRFVRRHGGRWLDLVTGFGATVRVEEVDDNWPALAADLDARLLAPTADRTMLLDFGRLGTSRWFEARATAVAASSAREAVAREVTGVVDAYCLARGAGFVCATARAGAGDEWHLFARLARALRDLGLVAIRPAVAPDPGALRALAVRHVGLICSEADPPERAVAWVRALSAWSSRRHLHCVVCAAWPGGHAFVREAALAWSARPAPPGGGRDDRVSDVAKRVRDCIAAADLDHAETELAAVRVESTTRGRAIHTELALLDVELKFWRGEFAEAAAILASLRDDRSDVSAWRGLIRWATFDSDRLVESVRAPAGHRLLARLLASERDGDMGGGTPDRSLTADARRGSSPSLAGLARRWLRASAAGGLAREAVLRELVSRGVAGIMRWGHGRDRMRVLHFVPGLLQVVHEAEDEGIALASACSWLRTHAGASGVAIVSEQDGGLIAHDGWRGELPRPHELAAVCRERPGPGGLAAGKESAWPVTAPVRYGGSVIGHVVARGSSGDPGGLEEGVQALAALAGPALRARLDARVPPDDATALMPEVIGRSPATAAVRAAVEQAARTFFPVLIEGESGTGKELVARALHRLSSRKHRRFMAVNCAALTDDLVEAELFGFARGAFTGAMAARSGLFEEASGGSLFLDEVSELSARAQAKLLRALQEREIRRVGENVVRPVDVRVIAATNLELGAAVRAQRFREDLLFRLAVVRIGLPPLRDRLEDLPGLAAAFWRQAMRDVGKHVRLTRGALAALSRHAWPGNIRELQNVLAALAVRAPARGRLGEREVRQVLAGPPAGETGVPLGDLRRQCERRAVAGALARNGGRRTAAARELGLSRQGLSKAIRRLGLGDAPKPGGVA